jgi:hypothetical protein
MDESVDHGGDVPQAGPLVERRAGATLVVTKLDRLARSLPDAGDIDRCAVELPTPMNRIALVARLKPGAEYQASGLLEQGPPFDPAERGLVRHAVYLSAGEVVFEGDEVEWIVNEIVNEPFGAVAEALGTWRELVEDPPRIARPVYSWGSDDD